MKLPSKPFRTRMYLLISTLLTYIIFVSCSDWNRGNGYTDNYVNVYDYLNAHNSRNSDALRSLDNYADSMSEIDRIRMLNSWRREEEPVRRSRRRDSRQPDREGRRPRRAYAGSGFMDRSFRNARTPGRDAVGRIPGTWGS